MKEKKLFYGWWVVFGCMLITATMVPPIVALSNKYLIQVTTDMGISRSSFSLVNTILQALGIFLSPFVAKKMASGNMKRNLVISIIGYVAAYASYSIAQNVIHLYISAVFLGIFYLNSTFIPVSMIITNWFEKKRGIAISLAMAGIGIGGFVFSPVITYFLENFGWRNTYRIMALIVLVIALPTALFLLKKKPEEMGLKPYGSEEGPETKLQTEKKVQKDYSHVFLSVSESKYKLFFLLLLLGMLANGLINSGALGQFPPALEEMHGPAVQAAIISIYSIVGVFGKLVLGWINDKFGVIPSAVIGCMAFGVSFFFMLMGSNVTMLYIMAVLFGLGDAIGTVTPPLVTGAIFDTEKYGEAYGIANSFLQIGMSFGSIMIAAIYDVSGSYKSAWILLFVLTMITMVSWCSSIFLSRKYCRTSADK